MKEINKAEELKILVYDIANQLENARLKIYQTEKCSWEELGQEIDDKLFSLQSQIRNISEEIGWMDFKVDNIN